MIDFKSLKKRIKSDTHAYPVIKVSLLGDSATQMLATALKGMAIENGYSLDLFESDYNQVERQVYDLSSDLYRHDAKYTVLYQSTHKLLEHYSNLSFEGQRELANERLEFIKMLCGSVSNYIICYNYPEIDDTIFGSYSNKINSSFTYQIRKLNYELMNLSQKIHNLYICDIASLQNKFGRDFLFSPSVYVSTDMLLSLDVLPYVASRTLDVICSIEGKIKKCIVIDLDNTIWGGIVGDDGWENLQIGHGLGLGKAFSEIQEWLKKLKNRGIIIAVCSKNDETKAKEVFEKNPEMILSLDDISVFIANWETKADNIRKIQSILNIGFDSMVFLDDNPFERAFVKDNIPEITVPDLPQDPAEYLEYLYSLNLFETASFSSEDLHRAELYQVDAKRTLLSRKYADENEFLASLDMVSVVQGFNKFNTPRVAQLSQRSNQFNLRTVRYTEEQIENLELTDKYENFSFTLEDKFGDNGLICVVVLEKIGQDSLFIESWFMSCRVLKRGLENFVLNTLVSWAKDNGFRKIIGEYIPTKKNEMVRNHYEKLGFVNYGEDSKWLLDISNYHDKLCFIKNKCQKSSIANS